MSAIAFKCLNCGKEVIRYNRLGKYCSRQCQHPNTTMHNCPVCGKCFRLIYSRKIRGWVHCSQACKNKAVEANKFPKEKLQENIYFWRMKTKYNLTREAWQALHDKFGGRCHICQQFETEMHLGKLRRLDVDHCHKTGKVRGLLCTKHNKLLGCAEDDIEILKAAIAYLEDS